MEGARVDGLRGAEGGHTDPAAVPVHVADTSGVVIPAPEAATGVVVGVDGSLGAREAVSWAAAHAARRGLALHLVQVLPGTPAAGPDGRARARLHRAIGAASAVAPQVPMTIATARGSVGPALVNHAVNARMLVVGSRGPAGPLPITPGRILAQVSGHARCPVVVVPPNGPGSWASTPSLRPVLVGVDGSPQAEHALAYAAEMADRLGVTLRVMTARTRHPETDQIPPAWPRPGERAEGRRRPPLEGCLADCWRHHPGLVLELVVAGGDPAQALLAAGRRAQLIVVGSRGRGAASAALLGSTSQTVLCHSPCAVMVVSPFCTDQIGVDAGTARAPAHVGGGGLFRIPGW